jgi:translation initiation factor 5B
MAPKKKAGKKAQQDDWEADIGETIDPIAEAAKNAKEEEDGQIGAEDDDAGVGLLAALRKNRQKKVKKGKAVEDIVEGEDPTEEDANGAATAPTVDLSSKAPEEANFDDEDVFGQPTKKGKGGKPANKASDLKDKDDDDDDVDASGRVKSKKEKEREKKEREKQRKKEQVRFWHSIDFDLMKTY